jgi:hypothetical protein
MIERMFEESQTAAGSLVDRICASARAENRAVTSRPSFMPSTFLRSPAREVVEKLRQENGKYRRRAAKADTYAQRLHTELVRATGKLADPTDLPFNEDHLDDPDAMTAAINDLVTRKPHLASRKPMGEIGQGATPSAATVDVAAVLRPRAQ